MNSLKRRGRSRKNKAALTNLGNLLNCNELSPVLAALFRNSARAVMCQIGTAECISEGSTGGMGTIYLAATLGSDVVLISSESR